MMEGKNEGVECDVCGQSHATEECPELGLSSAKFTPQISRARLTVPHYLNPVELMDGGVGILALEAISNKTQLGPFEAKKTMHDIDRDDLFVLKILSKDGSFISLDASSESHCNWMALVRVAQTEKEQNCMAYQLGINIYFNTTCDIAVGDELKVWYASQYAKKLNKSLVPDGKTKSMLGEVLLTETEEGGEFELEEETPADVDRESMEDPTPHPDDIEGNFVCKHCGKKFVSQFLFAKHIRGHLFPEYDYHDGPPRRGRRPVPLKQGYVGGAGGGQHSGRGRGRGRGRGKGRGRGRGAGGRGGKLKMSSDLVKYEEGEAVVGERDGSASESNTTLIGNTEDSDEITGLQEQNDASITETPGGKKVRGRPKKVAPEFDSAQSLEGDEVNVKQVGYFDTPLIPDSEDGSRPKRRARSFRNFGKLSKWFKYPGESSDEEDPASGDGSGNNTPKSRKKFGAAMAASLRKAAMDEMTSPVKRRKTEHSSNIVKSKSTASTSSDTGHISNSPTAGAGKALSAIKSEVKFEKPVVVKEAPIDMETKAEVTSLSISSSPTSLDVNQIDDDSPKKYIVVTKGDESTTYEISSSLVDEFEVPVSVSEASIEVSQEEPITKTLSVLSTAVSVDTSAISTVSEGGQQLEFMEVADVPKVEGDIIISTSEENVITSESQQHETSRKNTIADLDGTDALTALVNAAISADKVPDPIAMVAADLYDDKNLGDDDDGEDYRAPPKHITVETADEGDESGEEKFVSNPKPKRKKRRRGDDPELEALEKMTKKVEGPNGTEEFACGVCNKHFTQFKYLKLHLPAHTDRFRCNTCGKRFARNESLLKHTCDDTASLVEPVVDEEGMEMYTCKECGRNFSQLSFAIRHASMHRTRFPCDKCGRTFPRQELMEDHDCSAGHLEEGEVTLERYECQICKQAFTNGKYLFRHMAMHTDIYKCEVCGKCYSRKDSLQRHISRCCPELSEEYSVHVCQNCKKTFGTQLGLQNHLLNCGKYQCDACRVAFFSPKDLAEHECAGKVLNEKANVQFPCKECGKTFASIAYLVRHEASHHGAFKCDMCHRVFIRKEELNWHLPVCTIRQKIIQEGSAPCEICGEVYNEWLAFKEHHMTHTHPYKCDKCGKRFIKIGTLHNHKCDGVLEIANLLSCDICQKTFKNERYLSRHLSLHGQPEYSCEFCGKMFIRKDYLNDHQCRMPDGSVVRVIRKKNRLFIRDNLGCPECGKTFSSRSNMMKHMKVHGEKLAVCPICHKKFHYDNYLKLHIATVHEKQYQLQCKHCGKVLFSKTGLIAHIKQFHAETIQLYPCPKCGKTFRQKGNMKTHLISHSKERAFKCDICGKAFKYPDQLNRHRLEHTLSEKYACDMCDKQFVRSYELRNHVRNYHSGYVYVCGVCHECCAHRHTIIRHYKRKHPEVGNVFEEKPEFLDSLQKPVTAATQSRMMVEAEDVKPTIMQIGGHDIIVTTEEDGTQTYTTGDVILTQNAAGELLASADGDQAIHQVVEGGAQGDQTVFILKVVNQDENGSLQEMEITEDTKAHLAQLIQAHGVGPDITHIQVGDQTLQIQHEEDGNQPLSEEVQSVVMGQGQDGKLVEAITSTATSANLTQLQSIVSQQGTQPHQLVHHPHQITTVSGSQNGQAAIVMEHPTVSSVVTNVTTAVNQNTSQQQQQKQQQQVVSLVMPDGRLGQLISVDGDITGAGVSLGSVGDDDVDEAAAHGQALQFMEVDVNGQFVLTAAPTAGAVSMTSQDGVSSISAHHDPHSQSLPLIHQQEQEGHQELPGIKVRKRRRSNGEIVVEVEGEAGNLIDLRDSQVVMDLVQQGQLVDHEDEEEEDDESGGGVIQMPSSSSSSGELIGAHGDATAAVLVQQQEDGNSSSSNGVVVDENGVVGVTVASATATAGSMMVMAEEVGSVESHNGLMVVRDGGDPGVGGTDALASQPTTTTSATNASLTHSHGDAHDAGIGNVVVAMVEGDIGQELVTTSAISASSVSVSVSESVQSLGEVMSSGPSVMSASDVGDNGSGVVMQGGLEAGEEGEGMGATIETTYTNITTE